MCSCLSIIRCYILNKFVICVWTRTMRMNEFDDITTYTIATHELPQKTNSITSFIDATKKNKNYYANG